MKKLPYVHIEKKHDSDIKEVQFMSSLSSWPLNSNSI